MKGVGPSTWTHLKDLRILQNTDTEAGMVDSGADGGKIKGKGRNRGQK